MIKPVSQHNLETSASSTDSADPAPVPATATPKQVATGLLSIKVVEARGLRLAPGSDVPNSVKAAFVLGGDSPVVRGGKRRDSVQRQSFTHLPYLVLSYDNNEVLVDALGGTHSNPGYFFSTSFDVCRNSDITVSAFLRVGQAKTAARELTHKRVESECSKDIFLSATRFTPVLDVRRTTDNWYPAADGAGEFRIQIGYRSTGYEPLNIDAFELLKVIGKGSFGKVMLVKKKDTGRHYALKSIRKAHIVSRSEVTHTLAERTVLAQVNSPFIVPLKFSFQSPEKLYLVLSFISGGELFHHLQAEGRFDEARSRFYAAELLCALDHLHSFDIIYRDLKPENILIDYTGHLMLCDFGLCKLNMSQDKQTNTFAGTPEYLSPELILGEGYSRVVDWWTLGVLLYEMITGLPPFYEEDHQKMYKRIVEETLSFPSSVRPEAKRILTGLLQKNPKLRLGSNGAEEIRRHLFFYSLDWAAIARRGVTPPFRPSVESAIDTSNVDSEFLAENPVDSYVEDSVLSGSTQAQFAGFTYSAPTALGESVR